MLDTLKGIKEEQVRLMAQADAILADADRRSNGTLGAEDDAKYTAIVADIEKLMGEEARRHKHEELQRSIVSKKHAEQEAAERAGEKAGEVADTRAAFEKWLRTGERAPLTAEERAVIGAGAGKDSYRVSLLAADELRAMSTTSSTEGAKSIPKGFVPSLERARLAFGDVRAVATVIQTERGNELPFPVSNDTGNKGIQLDENTQVQNQDIAISEIVLNAYKFSSDQVLISLELLQDEAVDLQGHIGAILGERLGRITNEKFTTGSGTNTPNGIVTSSFLGKTAAGAAAVTYAELVDLQHSVDPAYQGNAKWMFKFSTLAALKKIVDGDSRPLWQPAMGAGMGEFPATLLGRPYVINQEMPAMTTGLKSILYGDFSKYLVREVKDITLLRLNERYAEYGQVGFFAFLRTDADLLDAGTHPVKHLIQA